MNTKFTQKILATAIAAAATIAVSTAAATPAVAEKSQPSAPAAKQGTQPADTKKDKDKNDTKKDKVTKDDKKDKDKKDDKKDTKDDKDDDGAAPKAVFQVESDNGCAPFTLDADASQSTASELHRLEWSIDDGKPTSTSTSPRYTTILDKPGEYVLRLVVFDTEGRQDSTSKKIVVKGADDPACRDAGGGGGGDGSTVKAEAERRWLTACDAQPMSFDATASTGTGLTYAWDFESDGTTDATSVTAEHTYGPGTYRATITVTDSAGKTDTEETEEFTVDACNTEVSYSSDNPAPVVSGTPTFTG